MPSRYRRELLLEHFLKSETCHWVRFVPALPLQAAYYHDAHVGGGVLHRYLLHLTQLSGTCQLVLEVGSHTTSQGGLIFDATSFSREVALEPLHLNFAEAAWPAPGDALVGKAHNID